MAESRERREWQLMGCRLTDSYRSLKGRAAEKRHDFLAENIGKHFVTPEFVGETAEKAAPVLMKYDMETKSWKANADEGNCSFDMKWAVEGIQYSKDGSVHNFTTSKAIDGEKIVKVKRKTEEGSSAENLFVSRTMRAANGCRCYLPGRLPLRNSLMRLKTDVPAEVTVEKRGCGNRKIHSGGADAV